MIEMWVFFSAIGIAIPLINKVVYHKTITAYEALAIALINSAIVGAVMYTGTYTQLHDVELVNGQVTDKHIDTVPCSHSYPCRCRPVSCGKNCITTRCDTCYQHPHDYDHIVETSVGAVTIAREDSQGTVTPPLWAAAQIGEPVTLPHSFTNYIKAAPDSLFNLAYLRDDTISVPDYPKVFDYYHVNRVINLVPKSSINANEINRLLNLQLRSLGPQKELNIVVVLWDSSQSDHFVDALKAKWLGGKQNDIIIAIKLSGSEIKEVDSFGFSKDSAVYYQLNRSIKDLGSLAGAEGKFVDLVTDIAQQKFVRQPMAEFEYLQDSIDPPLWVVIVASLFSILGTLFASYLAHKYDFFGTESSSRR